ncbi:gamma-glutamylcyclotransferase family protein [Frigidibacter sp. MR17.14]|uniref:gamma-glutamylcyclotransferase family protein n=1 Tax=Frigidibacter sp. MR17.14 TaxID=3126509 RepID=UPI0030130870
MTLYFAYGSNLLPARLTARCPGARALGPAWLADHRLDLSKPGADGSGKATIRPAPGSVTPGALYHLPDEELPLLDAFEGLGHGYGRARVTLDTIDGPTEAWTYQALLSADLPAYDWYLGLCLAGRAAHGLPLDDLMALPWMPDPEPARETGRHARTLLAAAGFALSGLPDARRVVRSCTDPGLGAG